MEELYTVLSFMIFLPVLIPVVFIIISIIMVAYNTGLEKPTTNKNKLSPTHKVQLNAKMNPKCKIKYHYIIKKRG